MSECANFWCFYTDSIYCKSVTLCFVFYCYSECASCAIGASCDKIAGYIMYAF